MKISSHLLFFLSSFVMSTLAAEAPERQSEFRIMSGHGVMNDYSSPLPHTYLKDDDLPRSFSWHDVEGISYLTKSLNQHIPQYCGSCWAHGALSSLADRIKIARGAKGDDINLSIQYVLNCGARTAGSCHGGSATGTFQFIKEKGFVPYDTCMPYIACSSESKEGFCPHADTTCNSYNTCRTCGTFGTDCKQVSIQNTIPFVELSWAAFCHCPYYFRTFTMLVGRLTISPTLRLRNMEFCVRTRRP
mmetsp:Transcript_21833/g.49660  ORF Transcript_21833/g.49660 Transcript_21833/m.49660 type:complete len:246 (-) Transcript_21833:586-1323(-)